MDPTGRLLDSRYRLEREVLVTWMSSVWLATDTDTGDEVRIRMPSQDLVEIPGFAEAALREFHARAGHRVPHQQAIRDAGAADGVPFAVLDPAEGGSLADLLEDGAVDLDVLGAWLPPVGAALDRMHERGVVHRDVVPGNVVFDARREPALADDSISTALGEVAPDRAPEVANPGELGDRPPEILEKTIGPAYDQYSLAATVFRCLAGRELEPTDTYLGVGQTLAAALPPPAVEVLERALSVVPGERYSSCGAFVAAFLDAAGIADEEMDETGTLMMDVGDLVAATGVEDEDSVEILLATPVNEDTGEIPVAAPLPVEDEKEERAPPREPEPKRPPPSRPSRPSPAPAAAGKRKSRAPLAIAIVVLLAAAVGAALALNGRGSDAERKTAATPLAHPAGGTGPEPGHTGENPPTPEPGHTGENPPTPEPGHTGENPPTPEPGHTGENPPTPEPGHPGENPPTPEPPKPPKPFTASIQLSAPAEGALVGADSITLEGRVQGDPAEAVRIGKLAAKPGADGTFSLRVPLESGQNDLTVTPYGPKGAAGTPTVLHVVRDTTAPRLEVDAPTSGFATKEATVQIRGRVIDDHPRAVRIGTRETPVDAEGRFAATVDLPEGESPIAVVAEDQVGNESAVTTLRVIHDSTPPRLRLDAPSGDVLTKDPDLVVRGALVDEFPDHVVVDGTPVPAGGGTFETRIRLSEGSRQVAVTGFDRAGNSATTGFTATLDTKPPLLRIDNPAEGATFDVGRVRVTGHVEDANLETVRVGTVNVEPTADGSFSVEVDLKDGENPIRIVATDRVGHETTVLRTVSRAVHLAVLQVHLDPIGADFVTAPTVTVTGTVDPAGGKVTVAGKPATVDGTKFRLEVPIGPGRNPIEAVASAPGFESASARIVVVRPREGEPMAGPATIRTVAEETIRLESGATLLRKASPPDGSEALELTAGTARGTLGDRTRLDLPAGFLAVRSGETATFSATARGKGRAEVSVSKGRVLLTHLDDRVLLGEGQSVQFETDAARPGYLHFWTGAGNKEPIVVLRQVTDTFTVWLRSPGKTDGAMETVTGGDATRVACGADSAGSLTVWTDRAGTQGASSLVAPGASTEIEH